MAASVETPFTPPDVNVGGLLSASLSRLNSLDAFDVHLEVSGATCDAMREGASRGAVKLEKLA
jgi:hypothetical protein